VPLPVSQRELQRELQLEFQAELQAEWQAELQLVVLLVSQLDQPVGHIPKRTSPQVRTVPRRIEECLWGCVSCVPIVEGSQKLTQNKTV